MAQVSKYIKTIRTILSILVFLAGCTKMTKMTKTLRGFLMYVRRACIGALAVGYGRKVRGQQIAGRICDGKEDDALESWAEDDALAGDCDGLEVTVKDR